MTQRRSKATGLPSPAERAEAIRREAIGSRPVTRAEMLKILHDLSHDKALTVLDTWARYWRLQ